ncbi:MAG: dihydropteroate synthase [Actinomycetota bacterium]
MSCLVMGILNRTPDSFYDGGRTSLTDALRHAREMAAHGCDIVDVGGVKAGPGAPVSLDEELSRVAPLVEALRSETDAILSVETGRPEVAKQVLEMGAGIINDVTALADPELAAVCARSGARLVLMHHGGQIRGRPRNPRYDDVVADVIETWRELAEVARSHGVRDEDLIYDPGLDFGKTTFHSLELMRRLPELTEDRRVLIAASRKDVVGETLGLPLEERLEGSLALVALSALYGAAIVRVHDVKESVRVVRMVEAVMGERPPAAPIRGLWE